MSLSGGPRAMKAPLPSSIVPASRRSEILAKTEAPFAESMEKASDIRVGSGTRGGGLVSLGNPFRLRAGPLCPRHGLYAPDRGTYELLVTLMHLPHWDAGSRLGTMAMKS